MSFEDLMIEEYTAKSVVVYGDTRKYKEDLKKLGGKYNGRLKNGPGWIFSKSSENDLRSFVKEGKRLVTAEEAKEGEERSKQRVKEWDSQNSIREKKYHGKINGSPLVEPTFGSNVSPTLTEYASMMNILKKMSAKVELIEHTLFLLLTDDQKEKLNLLMKTLENKSVKKKIVFKNKMGVESEVESDSDDNEDVPRKRLMR